MGWTGQTRQLMRTGQKYRPVRVKMTSLLHLDRSNGEGANERISEWETKLWHRKRRHRNRGDKGTGECLEGNGNTDEERGGKSEGGKLGPVLGAVKEGTVNRHMPFLLLLWTTRGVSAREDGAPKL